MKKENHLDSETVKELLKFQRNEITEYKIYLRLSQSCAGKNKETLKRIAEDELGHYNKWKKFTGADVKPDMLKVLKYYIISRIAGLIFAVKLMESGEENAQAVYGDMIKAIPEAKGIIEDENRHEKELIGMIDEERLNYVGSMVLGINDALVELTGTIAGLTFALQNAKIVGMAAMITGIAASLSMASSEYLSKKSEGHGKSPLRASFYTGLMYVMTSLALIIPFFLWKNPYIALGETLVHVVLIIFLFTFFISVTKSQPFRKRFVEMVTISLGVAAVSFLIGYAAKTLLNVDA